MKSLSRASGACSKVSWVARRNRPNQKRLLRTRRIPRQLHLRKLLSRKRLRRSQHLHQHRHLLLHIAPTASAFLLNGSTNALALIRTCDFNHRDYRSRRRSYSSKGAYTPTQLVALSPPEKLLHPVVMLDAPSQSGHLSRTSAKTSSTEERTRVYQQTSRLRHQLSALKPSGDLASFTCRRLLSASSSAGTISSHLFATLVLLNGTLASGYSPNTLGSYGVTTFLGLGFIFLVCYNPLYTFPPCMHGSALLACLVS